jgi:hypothetical protein
MAQAKVELKVGSLSFSGEAEASWLEKQLDKLLEYAKNRSGSDSSDMEESESPKNSATGSQTGTGQPLGTYLKSRSANNNQTRKFLATAAWLSSKSKSDLRTADVTKALSDNRQNKLGNASQCLNENITKGYCEKRGKAFFVTEHGHEEINK